MVGESFERYLSQMAKNDSDCPPWMEKNLKCTYLKWLKMIQIVHHGWRKF